MTTRDDASDGARSENPDATVPPRIHHAEESMRAKANVKRAGVVMLLALALAAWPLAAMTNCAQFITTAEDDAPNSGWLTGERTETSSSTFSYSGSWSYLNFGGTFNGSSTKTQSYSVGIYEMEGGGFVTLRCDTYQPV
jgi:hypothetical protein